jgi:uncharacterized iron-regulated membrane protein
MISRRYHRWIATLLGLFILWTAGTGIITQITRINTAAERQAAAAASRATQIAPAPPLSPNRQFLKMVTDLHSGERFGLAGQLISLVIGLAILFLAGSGLWMYVRMFRARGKREHERFFWK